MKYYKAVQQNWNDILSKLQRSKCRSKHVAGWLFTMYPVVGAYYDAIDFPGNARTFHVIAVLEMQTGKCACFCGEITGTGGSLLTPFWVDELGRHNHDSERAQTMNIVLNELYPTIREINDLSFESIKPYILRYGHPG